jgi:hypothetical protein
MYLYFHAFEKSRKMKAKSRVKDLLKLYYAKAAACTESSSSTYLVDVSFFFF